MFKVKVAPQPFLDVITWLESSQLTQGKECYAEVAGMAEKTLRIVTQNEWRGNKQSALFIITAIDAQDSNDPFAMYGFMPAIIMDTIRESGVAMETLPYREWLELTIEDNGEVVITLGALPEVVLPKLPLDKFLKDLPEMLSE